MDLLEIGWGGVDWIVVAQGVNSQATASAAWRESEETSLATASAPLLVLSFYYCYYYNYYYIIVIVSIIVV
jgi:hypothetical protein